VQCDYPDFAQYVKGNQRPKIAQNEIIYKLTKNEFGSGHERKKVRLFVNSFIKKLMFYTVSSLKSRGSCSEDIPRVLKKNS
jgi:hypothetical protein